MALNSSKALTYLVITIMGLALMYPLFWMLSSSFKPEQIIFQQMGLWPSQFTLDNYIKGWKGLSGISFATFYVNTFIVVGLVILGNLITCSMTAFAFARIDFTFKKIFFAAMLTTIMLPQHVVLIPQYIIFNKLEWINTYYPLIVPKFLATDAFFIFLMVQFIRSIPNELDQAAIMDGCNPFQTFGRIIVPLLQPALVTTAIFTFIWTYNDFFSQLIYISNPKMFTIALGLRMFLDNQGTSAWGSMFAMSIISLLPVMLFFTLFQRLIIEGVTTGSLKG
ncbi:carbohydrate ABC transporter permease [Paenibacillus piri]|uniref:Carbohydrate ABC transporter permease n=1 Tax=Paenibacillus piri TaxID=2547395 RepID=A0A4R5K6V1_9BACL|nr:carbohydrate ABC transporter permease [Paenibacillus piri]TDF89194.1 carbohydrate ABC transporter permease [Paenibacillus piri]